MCPEAGAIALDDRRRLAPMPAAAGTAYAVFSGLPQKMARGQEQAPGRRQGEAFADARTAMPTVQPRDRTTGGVGRGCQLTE